MASLTSSWLSSIRRIFRLFKTFLCIDPVYDEILASVRGRIWKQHTWFRELLEEGLNLAVTLRHLVAGSWHHVLWHAVWPVGGCLKHSVVIREVYQAICDEYADEVLTKLGCRQLADGFYGRWNVLHCVAAIDGKYMAIRDSLLCLARYIMIYDFCDFVSSEAWDRPKTLKIIFLVLYFINYIHNRCNSKKSFELAYKLNYNALIITMCWYIVVQ